MSHALLDRLDRITKLHGEAQWKAAAAWATTIESRKNALKDVFAAAAEIVKNNGISLAGQKFSFSGPDPTPIYDLASGTFVAHVFNAWFGDVSNQTAFGICVSINSRDEVEDFYVGAAQPPNSTPDSVADQFIEWLDIMMLYYPALRAQKAGELSEAQNPLARNHGGWMGR